MSPTSCPVHVPDDSYVGEFVGTWVRRVWTPLSTARVEVGDHPPQDFLSYERGLEGSHHFDTGPRGRLGEERDMQLQG